MNVLRLAWEFIFSMLKGLGVLLIIALVFVIGSYGIIIHLIRRLSNLLHLTPLTKLCWVLVWPATKYMTWFQPKLEKVLGFKMTDIDNKVAQIRGKEVANS